MGALSLGTGERMAWVRGLMWVDEMIVAARNGMVYCQMLFHTREAVPSIYVEASVGVMVAKGGRTYARNGGKWKWDIWVEGQNLLKRLVFSRSRVSSVGDCIPRDVCVVERHEIVDHPLPVLWNTRSRKIEGRQAWAWIDRWNSNNSSSSSSSLRLHKLFSKHYWLDFIHVVLLNFLKRLAFSKSRAPSVGDFVPWDVCVVERHEIINHPLSVFLNTRSRKIERRRAWIDRWNSNNSSSSSRSLRLHKLWSKRHWLDNFIHPSSTFLGCHLVLQALGLHYKHPNLGDIGGYMLDDSDEETNLPRLFEIVWLLHRAKRGVLKGLQGVGVSPNRIGLVLGPPRDSIIRLVLGYCSRAIAIKLRHILPPLPQIINAPLTGFPFSGIIP
nr:hypothetical protein Iba_chr15bCG9300 [Ipomoea batatas]